MQDASSIDQQVRACREFASRFDLQIDAPMLFGDEAKSGMLNDRDGLNALMAAARERRFQILFVYDLSRLSRILTHTLGTVEELVSYGVRVVGVIDGLDTARPGWKTHAGFRAIMNEEYIETLRVRVLAGQGEAVVNNRCVGDWCYGYSSEAIPGTERRGGKPRKRYVLVPEQAEWVRRIFSWFVADGWSIERIVRELRQLGAPLSPKWRQRPWSRLKVRTILRNRKYIGKWVWGRMKTVRDMANGKRPKQVPRRPHEYAAWERDRPELRLVENAMFELAQAKLDKLEAECREYRNDNGRLSGSSPRDRAWKFLMHRVLFCECGAPFQTTGQRYLKCRGSYKGACAFRSFVDRTYAQAQVCGLVRTWLSSDACNLENVYAAARAAYEMASRQADREEEVRLQKSCDELGLKITRLLRRIEETDDPDVGALLTLRQQEKRASELRLHEIRLARQGNQTPPTLEWVRGQLDRLHEVLAGDIPDANALIRELLGPVTVRAEPVPGRKRPRLVARCCPTLASVVSAIGGSKREGDAVRGEALHFDLTPPPPWAARSGEVIALLREGLTHREIAIRLVWPTNWVPKAIRWYESLPGNGPLPKRKKPWRRPRKVDEVREEAKRLFSQGMSIFKIADRLKAHKETISKALGRSRRTDHG